MQPDICCGDTRRRRPAHIVHDAARYGGPTTVRDPAVGASTTSSGTALCPARLRSISMPEPDLPRPQRVPNGPGTLSASGSERAEALVGGAPEHAKTPAQRGFLAERLASAGSRSPEQIRTAVTALRGRRRGFLRGCTECRHHARCRPNALVTGGISRSRRCRLSMVVSGWFLSFRAPSAPRARTSSRGSIRTAPPGNDRQLRVTIAEMPSA